MCKILSDFIITRIFLISSFCSSIRAACRRIECFDGVVAEVILEPTLLRVSLYVAVRCQHCGVVTQLAGCTTLIPSRSFTQSEIHSSSFNFCGCFRELILCSNAFTKQKKRVGILLTVEKVNRHFVKTLTQTLCCIVVVDLPHVCT